MCIRDRTETVLEELEFCLPAGDHTAQEVESAETARSISAFLRSQPEQALSLIHIFIGSQCQGIHLAPFLA